MARTIKDARLDSRAARSRLDNLPTGDTVHWRTLVPGQLHLGYRRRSPDVPGVWIARRYVGKSEDKKSGYRKDRLGVADDFRDADGTEVLSYADAQRKAHALADAAAAAPAQVSPATVADVASAYVEMRDRRETARQGREVRSDASRRLSRYVLGQEARGSQKAVPAAPLAAVRLADLTEADLRGWRAALPDSLKSTTVRRLVNDLRAALNAGYAADRAALDPGLPKIVEYGLKAGDADEGDGESTARDDQILPDATVARLLAAAREIDAEDDWDGDLLRMVLVLAATGARFSQVARIRVGDLQPAQGRLMVPVSRKGNRKKERTHVPVPIGPDVVAALAPAATGRPSAAPLLERHRLRQVEATRWERIGRGPWLSSSELTRPFAKICERAGIPGVVPYALRHTSIVRGIRANLPIRLVAAAHDTSVGIVEKHYSRFIVSGLEEMLRSAIVPLVPPEPPGDNVVQMRTRAAT